MESSSASSRDRPSVRTDTVTTSAIPLPSQRQFVSNKVSRSSLAQQSCLEEDQLNRRCPLYGQELRRGYEQDFEIQPTLLAYSWQNPQHEHRVLFVFVGLCRQK